MFFLYDYLDLLRTPSPGLLQCCALRNCMCIYVNVAFGMIYVLSLRRFRPTPTKAYAYLLLICYLSYS